MITFVSVKTLDERNFTTASYLVTYM
jgi:hypothetical protein